MGATNVYFTHTGSPSYVSVLRPGSHGSGYLGTSSYNWGYIYTRNLYSDYIILDGQLLSGSDGRYKKNVKELSSSLDKVKLLRGVSYDKSTELKGNEENVSDSLKIKSVKEFGYIAQELNEVVPDAVHYDKENDKYSVAYLSIIPLITEAMKEQQALIEQQQAEIEALKKDLEKIKKQ